jgi:hypothetical protein
VDRQEDIFQKCLTALSRHESAVLGLIFWNNLELVTDSAELRKWLNGKGKEGKVAPFACISAGGNYMPLDLTYICMGPLSPRHGASSGSEWRRQPPDMEGSCEYIE